MIDINLIREDPEKVKKGVADKGFDPSPVDDVLRLNEQRLSLIGQIDRLREERNKLGKEEVERGRQIKDALRELEPKLDEIEKQLKKYLLKIPNLPAEDVPVGRDESENVVIRKWGEIPKFDFTPKDHLELGEVLDIIEMERASKVSGSRFDYLKNEGVILEFALIRYAFDLLGQEGFRLLIPPVLISLESMEEMGYLEYGREDMYILEKEGLVLVGTSEQAIGPMHKNEVLAAEELPTRYLGFSTCFRKEAGSYGKDTRGILRVHQFNKTEMFSFTRPEESDKEHEYLLSLEEKLMQGLELPYQVVKMCTGDLGVTAARKYDIEAWFPSQNKYRETHSTSNCTDYQARGTNTKFKSKEGVKFVHTLNGTAFSERPLIAILENNQQKDSSVMIPKALQSYTGFSQIKPR